jgi:4'-phosphopantetheinyl transferase
LSHREGRVLVALSDDPGAEVGVDLELVEPRSDGFVREWFTPAEVARVEDAPPSERDLLVTVIWSAKEAALKVLGLGLAVDTRGVEIRLEAPAEPWSPFVAACGPFPRIGSKGPYPAGTPVPGGWRREGAFVLTLAGGHPGDAAQIRD